MKTINDIKEKYNQTCVCVFRVMDAKLFFKTGKVQPVYDENTVSNVKQVLKAIFYHYDDYKINFACSAGVFFVCVNFNNNDSVCDILRFLARVVYQVQKYLLQKLNLFVGGCISQGKYFSNKTQICLNNAKIVLDVEKCSVLAQPYICVDEVTFSAEVKLLARENHLFKTCDDIYVINYFRFCKDVESMQFVVDYITKTKNQCSKQILLFKSMFDKACAKLKIDFANNS